MKGFRQNEKFISIIITHNDTIRDAHIISNVFIHQLVTTAEYRVVHGLACLFLLQFFLSCRSDKVFLSLCLPEKVNNSDDKLLKMKLHKLNMTS